MSFSALGLTMAASSVNAQAFNYPALQTPQVSMRDYTAALVGGSGSTLLFQWREGLSSQMHWQLETGLADPKGPADPLLFVGGGLGRELLRGSAEQPLDVLLTASAGAAFGSNGSVLRIPVGASIGHRFALDDGMSITPFVHPRIALDICSRCGTNAASRSMLSLNFDAGGLWQVNRQFGVLASAGFSGSDAFSDDETFSLGVRWTPAALVGNGRQ